MRCRSTLARGFPSLALFAAVAFPEGPSVYGQQIYTSYAFSLLAGTPDQSGSGDGPALAAHFYSPTGVAVDAGESVYVSDSYNSTIRKIAPNGTVTTLAGSPGQTGSTDGSGSNARFQYPGGIAVDAFANVYVADSGNDTIRKITPAGVVTTVAGLAGQTGSADGAGSNARFKGPEGVAVDSNGVLYVADSGNSLIRRIGLDGSVTTLAGGALYGNSDGTGASASFSSPQGLAVDGEGNLIVADTWNGLIRRVTPAGVVTTLGGGRVAGYGPFTEPLGVAIDAAGNILFTDGEARLVDRLSPSGSLSIVAGLTNYDRSAFAVGTGPSARFQAPSGIAVDASGVAYVTDSTADVVVSGSAVLQAPATVTLGNLVQAQNGVGKAVSVTTSPPGLSTVVLYDGSLSDAPVYQGTYDVRAIVTDPGYTGYAEATLTILPGPSDLPPFTLWHQVPGGSFLWGIAAGPPGLVCVGTGGTILTSTDGRSWVQRSSGSSQWLVAVAYGAGQYVAVGDNGTVLLSPDGTQWTNAGQAATMERLNNVIYAAGQYVAVGEGGAIVTSPDGHSWMARSSGLTGWLRGLTYLNSFTYTYGGFPDYATGTDPARFVAAGQGGTVLQSLDGATWTVVATGFSGYPLVLGSDVEALVPTPQDFAGVGANGTAFNGNWYQPDGTLALAGLPPPSEFVGLDPILFPGDFRCLVQGSYGLFAAGYNGVIVTATEYPSGGGLTWQQVSSGTNENLVNGLAVGDSIFIVGSDETILRSNPPVGNRLVNLSCRATVGGAGGPLIAGFVVGGAGTTGSFPLLVRSSGPALASFGVSGVLADPVLNLYSTSSAASLVATNSGWAGAVPITLEAEQVGAFPWSSDSSHDAALALVLGPGPYTANVTSQSGGSGVALTEIYDATFSATLTANSPRLVNLSARTAVGTGDQVLIAGFVIEGSLPKTVLIRASGPALSSFGVGGTLPDPKLVIFSSATPATPVASNTGWGGDVRIATAASWVGAFSWGSQATPDSAILVALPPGAYTAQVSGASGDTGNALIEVYEVQ